MILIPVLLFVYLMGYVGYFKMTSRQMGVSHSPLTAILLGIASSIWPVLILWSLFWEAMK